MATLLLAAAGSAIGASFGGAVMGISAAAIGQAAGAYVGNMIDRALFAPTQKVVGPRLDSVEVQKSAEGVGLPVVEGVGRVAGTVIWATRLEEVKSTSSQGGKGGGGSEVTEFSYFANFAVALTDCSTGPVRHFGRIWADGKLLDTSGLSVRFYKGTQTQSPDPLIVAKDGAAPAYRGISYVVFERMPVDDFGRRIPALMFEVWGPSGRVENLVRGVDLIPASTEFGYSTEVITAGEVEGEEIRENAVRDRKTPDWTASLDFMQDVLPNCGTVALVVSWFGTDMRAGHCQITPKVEIKNKNTSRPWSAAGLTRETAPLVSHPDGKPAFGSTPDDLSVIEAIRDLKARGLRVVLYPFMMMDIPAGNALPNRDGGVGQAVYPWRGRIGPAVGGGTVAAQIAALLGTATPAHFPAGSGVPSYTGPDEWSYRRFILHLAALARNAGGVDAFLIGSELVDLTTATDTAGVYPFVNGLLTLAANVKSMLPGAAVSYAADWSEYHSHRTGGQVYFHLDPLWSDPNVDFIGIDNYLPLSDWRPGVDHLDYDPAAGITSPYDLAYLKGQIEGGELWDYYYASQADRDAQIRTPIADFYGKPWVFRQKAIRDWWANAHHNRPGGIPSATATAWTPRSKPVWFTEFGCPAVNLGANQPNVFFDALTSEAALPYFSNGARDDFMQRQYLRAMLEWWGAHGGDMLSTDNALIWTWDSRPWPEFPRHDSTWSDGPNWARGHWINGRLGTCPARETLERRLSVHYGFQAADMDLSRCYGQADGAIIPGPLTFREFLATWETALRLDASEHGGILRIAARSAAIPAAAYDPADLVETGRGPLYTITRQSLEDVPRAAVVRYSDSGRDYEPGTARAAIRESVGEAEAEANLALVSDLPRMSAVAEMMLRAAADERESVEFTLPPSSTIEPGQVFTLTPRGASGPVRFIALDVTRGDGRRVRASLYSGAAFGASGGPGRASPALVRPPSGMVVPYFLDLPVLPGVPSEDHQGLVAFYSNPWPGGADLFRSVDESTGFSVNLRAGIGATVGRTADLLPPGRVGVWSGESLSVLLHQDADLVSRPAVDVLAGKNALAVEHAPGRWEVVQFCRAEIIGARRWRLSGLLRGQAGTEWTRSDAGLASGARVVVLDAAVLPVDMTPEEIGRPFYWRAVPAGMDMAGGKVRPHAFAGIGRRPYSPVHLRARRDGGNLVLDWKRRTRKEGDAWLDKGDVPLAEAAERYLVEVGPGAAPVRSLEVTTPAATLAVGDLSGAYQVRVAQVSETYGPGTWAALSVVL